MGKQWIVYSTCTTDVHDLVCVSKLYRNKKNMPYARPYPLVSEVEIIIKANIDTLMSVDNDIARF